MLSPSVLVTLLAASHLINGAVLDTPHKFAHDTKFVARQFGQGKNNGNQNNNGQNNGGQNNGQNGGQNNNQNNGQNGGQNNNQNNGQNGGQNNGGQTCLNNDLVQSASDLTGQEPGTEGIKPGQAPSATDPANFINFCAGQDLTNGQQILTGSCNGIPMGKIPANTNMVSAIITNPKPGDKITSDQTFNISVQTAHLDAGFFTNPTTNYYTAPQDLNQNGDIIGHCHVTVQDIGNLQSTDVPDATTFAFFKGIDDAGNGQGLLQATVTDGLPVGVYRVCTMIAARNHQPVNMPVAQRGAQDDCTKFEVVAANNGGGGKGKGKGGKSPNKDNQATNPNKQDQEGFVKQKPQGGNRGKGKGKGNFGKGKGAGFGGGAGAPPAPAQGNAGGFGGKGKGGAGNGAGAGAPPAPAQDNAFGKGKGNAGAGVGAGTPPAPATNGDVPGGKKRACNKKRSGLSRKH